MSKPTDPGTLSMEFNSMPKKLLDLVIGADDSALEQTADDIADEPIDTALNIWVPRSPTSTSATGFSLKTSADAAVDAAKYVVDYDDGQIMAIHADAVGTGMKASYTTEDVSGETYEGGKAKNAYLMLRGRAYNKRTGKWGRLLWLRPVSATKPRRTGPRGLDGGRAQRQVADPDRLQRPAGLPSPQQLIRSRHGHHAGALTLPDGLVWSDEDAWSPIAQSIEYGLTGSQIINEAVKQGGRPITLRGVKDGNSHPRSSQTAALSRLV